MITEILIRLARREILVRLVRLVVCRLGRRYPDNTKEIVETLGGWMDGCY